MPQLEVLKFVIQPVILERDDNGKVIGEKMGEPMAIYDPRDISQFVDTIYNEVARMNGSANNGSDPREPVSSAFN